MATAPNWCRDLDVSDSAVRDEAAARASFNKCLQKHKDAGTPKPDMKAKNELSATFGIKGPLYGHVPGIQPGDCVEGRSYMCLRGFHCQMMRGIDTGGKGQPSPSIVMSGGYKDDADLGSNVTYTGEGGQDKKSQVTDQEWRNGNLALKLNSEMEVPVRVFRKDGNSQDPVRYVYEGLYFVENPRQERSVDGPLVCKFDLRGVPGHHKVSVKVEWRFKALTQRRQLANRTEEMRTAKKGKKLSSGESLAVSKQLWKEEIEGMSGVKIVDISLGSEALPIPVVNEIDDEVPDLVYTPDYYWSDATSAKERQAIDQLLAQLDAKTWAWREATAGPQSAHCGCKLVEKLVEQDVKFRKNHRGCYDEDMLLPDDLGSNYNGSGQLMCTNTWGLFECGDACTRPKCQLNKQVPLGVQVKMVVFKTPGRGFGVRAGEDIKIGTFVAAYVGEVLLETTAEQRKGKDYYIFGLNHFTHLYEELAKDMKNNASASLPLYHLPKPPPANPLEVLDQAMRELEQQEVLEADKADAPDTAAAAAAAAGGTTDNSSPTGVAACTEGQSGEPGPSSRAPSPSAQFNDQAGVLNHTSSSSGAGEGEGEDATPASVGIRGRKAASQPRRRSPREHDNSLAPAGPAPKATGAKRGPGRPPNTQGSGSSNSSSSACLSSEDLQRATEFEPLLAVDACKYGNVARFFNHRCDGGNMALQPVFTKGCNNTLMYYICLFASMDIAKDEELTYDYNYGKHAIFQCQCGSASCVGLAQGDRSAPLEGDQ